MLTVRKSLNRGKSKTEWLTSYHTFSFADYHDEAWMHFGPLRVINEDDIKAHKGFDMHPHRDMEIITYVVSGALQHQDSMGNGSIIKPGEIQRMSAGNGILHSEFNHSPTESLHLLQIWIVPEQKGLAPSYEQKKIDKKWNQLILIGSHNPAIDAVKIHQNIEVFVGFFEKGERLTYTLNHHKAWLQVIKGHIEVNQEKLLQGDGMGTQGEKQLLIECLEPTEFLFFEINDNK